MPRVSAIVLAAGKSERMGRHKLLLPLGETTVIGNVLDSVLQSGVREAIVVTGHNADAVREAIGDRAVRVVHNEGYEAGMFSSVLRGLDAVAPDAEAIMIVLGDQPNVPPQAIDRLIEAFATGDKGLIVPTCFHGGRQRRGHPVLIAARYVAEIRQLSGTQGLRDLFVRHEDDTQFVSFDTPAVIDDLDTPEDYERLGSDPGSGRDPMQSLADEIVRLQAAGEPFALATVVARTGSVPMSKWAKMLVRADGTMSGTVGGGCLEAEIWEDARQALRAGEPRVVKHVLTPEHAGEFGLLCGGSVRILVERIEPDKHAEVFTAARDTVASRQRAHLITLLPTADEGTRRLLLMPDGSTVGSLGEESRERAAIEAAREKAGQMPELVSLGEPTLEVFIEPVGPVPEVYVFGGGHVGLATARIAAIAGFRVIVVDDRPMFCNPDRFPEADECIVAEFDGVFAGLDIGEDSYLVTVTRGHAHDETVVKQALRTNTRYIGMIGSRAKVRRVLNSLRERGATDEQLARLHAPIGLDIGADTPEEIAVSIVAEMIAVMRQGEGKRVKGQGARGMRVPPSMRDRS